MKTLYTFTREFEGKKYKFEMKKPSRSEADDINIFDAAILAKYMNAGVQTEASINKYYADNTDGAMTKDDEKEMAKLRKNLIKKEENLIAESDADKKRSLMVEIHDISERIRDFNRFYSGIYDKSAETMTRNKVIDFIFLNLSYVDGKQIFKSDEDDFSKRMIKQFDKFEELGENDFWSESFDRLVFLFTTWYMNAAENEEDLLEFHQTYFKDDFEEEVPEDLPESD